MLPAAVVGDTVVVVAALLGTGGAGAKMLLVIVGISVLGGTATTGAGVTLRSEGDPVAGTAVTGTFVNTTGVAVAAGTVGNSVIVAIVGRKLGDPVGN